MKNDHITIILNKRTLKFYGFAFILFLLPSISMAQTFENEQESEEVNGDEIIIDNNNVNTQVLNDLGFVLDFAPDPTTIIGNLVTVEQTGQFNLAIVSTITENSDVAVVQNGDNNAINLSYNTSSVFARLNQQGNTNQVIDFVSNPNANPALDLTQQGNNLSFERYGTNSLTNSLQFTQTAASPAIIVRSYQ